MIEETYSPFVYLDSGGVSYAYSLSHELPIVIMIVLNGLFFVLFFAAWGENVSSTKCAFEDTYEILQLELGDEEIDKRMKIYDFILACIPNRRLFFEHPTKKEINRNILPSDIKHY